VAGFFPDFFTVGLMGKYAARLAALECRLKWNGMGSLIANVRDAGMYKCSSMS